MARCKNHLATLGLLALCAACSPNEKLAPVSRGEPGNGDAGAEPDGGGTGTEDDLFAEPPTIAPTATGRGGAAATVDLRGSLAAIEVLKKGGNAVDAAVAAAGVLGATDPFSCGVGGGGFMLVYLAAEKKVVAIDHRETAPSGLEASSFYENGAPIALDELATSGLSVGVPGTVRGWSEALRRYGTLGLKDVLQRAIQVAEAGFEIDQTFFEQTGRNLARFQAITSSKELFLEPDGEARPVGTIFKNPDLARTYRLIADGGEKAFYEGEIAEAIVAAVLEPPIEPGSTLKVRPGVIAPSDLQDYEVRVRPALSTTYRDYTIHGVGLPSSGGITVAEALNLLEGFDLATLTPVEVLHRYLGASRLAFADRGTFLGDPEFVEAPVAGLLSKDYADSRRDLIALSEAPTSAAAPGDPFVFQTDPSPSPGGGRSARKGGAGPNDAGDNETTHITISDTSGNIVSYTCTIEREGGNGMVVPGHGFLLNNELTDFNIPSDPAAPHPNVAEPGKRPRSSMSPTLVMKDGKPELALASPGGSTIITTVLQILVGTIDLGLPIDKALAAPRISQRNAGDGSSDAEAAFLVTPEAEGLRALGHVFSDANTTGGEIGAATALRFHGDGTVTAVAEPVRRQGGSAMVEHAP
ncbi:gamma-glutamyltransferase [Sorangium cellulosum]|uniref:Glutathione hydrolase proenzyme n=1 Tax=Sorangium cellulosum TaxID=56 RepID=A0A2L0EI19_SORCE|nr:gamma-glutamyltransferase [Sorangium cellulosum]AUX38937.1 gamma-glutamyltransferase [Sorangium cellulosum]